MVEVHPLDATFPTKGGEPEKKKAWYVVLGEVACGAVVRPTFRDGEDSEERTRKWIVTPMWLLSVIFFAGTSGLYLFHGYWAAASISMGILANALVATFNLFVRKVANLVELEVGFVVFGVGLLLLDSSTHGTLELWAGVIVMMDALLLAGCCGHGVPLLRALTVVYIVCKTIDEAVDYGLYDLFEFGEHGDRAEPIGLVRGVQLMFVRLCIFLLDLTMTMYFAHGQRDEHHRVMASVRTAQELAQAMVEFDLQEAQTKLGGVDGELHRAFKSLLGNLQAYRPYIPEALFATPESRDIDPHVDALNMSLGVTTKAIVFTDIQSSTMLWEACPAAMRCALRTHNEVMRGAIKAYNGYEVKTIGDSFMVAFASALDACSFVLSSQVGLYEASWPHDLLNQPLCRKVVGAWCGLRVRMGIHVGEVDEETNPITHRSDFFGQTVNKAARVQSTADGGFVAVTDEVLQQAGAFVRANFSIEDTGEHVLPGVADSTRIHSLVPNELYRRKTSEPVTPTRAPLKLSFSMCNTGAPTFLKSRLSACTGSVATLRIDHSYLYEYHDVLAGVNEVLGLVLTAVDKAEGTIAGVSSGEITVYWKGATHLTQALRFSAMVYGGSVARPWAEHITVGIATGRYLYGNVGSAQQRFVTILGRCVEQSGFLASAAKNMGTFALAINRAMERDSSRGYVRPVAEVQGATVYEVNIRPMADDPKWWKEAPQPTSWEWSPEYWTVYRTGDTRAVLSHIPLNDSIGRRAVGRNAHLQYVSPLGYEPPLSTDVTERLSG